MSDSIQSPIIVAEGQDISVFSSTTEAEEHLARHPSPAGERLLFDAQARILKIDAAPSSAPSGGAVAGAERLRLSLAKPESVREADLTGLLQEYLQACGERVRPGAPLAELIRRCRSIQLYRE
jgi:hypothetical protein